jgi:hypothetical protein
MISQTSRMSWKKLGNRFLTEVPMCKDEIMEEIWRNRDAYAQKHRHDLDEMVRDLQQRQRKSPLKMVDRRKRRNKRSE